MTPVPDLAEQLVDSLGGPANVAAVEHCVTRLRFVLRDPGRVQAARVRGLRGVVSVVHRAGQFQVVLGNEVTEVFAAIEAMPGIATRTVDDLPGVTGAPWWRSVLDRTLRLLMGTFQPLLWALVGASLIRTGLAVAVQLGWTSEASAAYGVWAAAGGAVFTFLPVLVGVSAARNLGANPYVGGALGAALLEPAYTGLGATGTVVTVLGLPLQVTDYSGSVFPAMIAAVLLAALERRLKAWLPKDLHLILVPGLCLALLVPLTFFVFGPVGGTVSVALSEGLDRLWSLSPPVAGAALGGLWQVLVMLGVHWGLTPVIVNDIASQGHSLLTGPLVAAVLAQGAAALAVLRRTRDRGVRLVAGPAAVSAFVAGVTEPAIYGVNLRLRRPFLYACFGGALGGAIAAAGRSAAEGFVIPGLVSLPAYARVGSFGLQLLGCAAAVVVAFGLTWVAGVRDEAVSSEPDDPGELGDPGDPGDPGDGGRAGAADASAAAGDGEGLAGAGELVDRPVVAAPVRASPGGTSPRPDTARDPVVVVSPMAGVVVPLASVSDPVFARGLLGPGVAVRPDDGWVRAPVTGTVSSVARARHAVGVTSDDGVDVLVHVGVDTVSLGGAGFDVAVRSGARVVVGQVLVHVDRAELAARGCDLTTPVVVTNAAGFAGVEVVADGVVPLGGPLLRVRLHAAARPGRERGPGRAGQAGEG